MLGRRRCRQAAHLPQPPSSGSSPSSSHAHLNPKCNLSFLSFSLYQLQSDGAARPLTNQHKAQLMASFGSAGLRMLALAYRDIDLAPGTLGKVGREAC